MGAVVADISDKMTRAGRVARMTVYLEWLLTPAEMREPRTKTELAEQLGISMETLRLYNRDPWLRHEWNRRARTHFRIERATEVITTLYETATDSSNARSVAAAKILLEWMEQTDRADDESFDASKLTDEELEELSRLLEEEG